MPSFSHDGLVRLFHDRPLLAVELLAGRGVEVPTYTDARIESADATDIEPAARHADLVVLLVDRTPVLAIIVEVQLGVDGDKPFRWPAYLANVHSRLRCPVELLVVTPSARVAAWATRPIPLGRGEIRPVVVGPDGVPVITDLETARRDPELAVLSALSHGRDSIDVAVPVAAAALAAVVGYPNEKALLYSDLVLAALSEKARAALEELMRTDGYEYQSEFARQHRAEGKAEGAARALLTILEARGLTVSAAQRTRILASTNLSELEAWLRKAASASSIDDVLA